MDRAALQEQIASGLRMLAGDTGGNPHSAEQPNLVHGGRGIFGVLEGAVPRSESWATNRDYQTGPEADLINVSVARSAFIGAIPEVGDSFTLSASGQSLRIRAITTPPTAHVIVFRCGPVPAESQVG